MKSPGTSSGDFFYLSIMRIETENFILRDWLEADAESLVQVANNKKIYDNLRDLFPHPYSIEDAKAFIKMTQQANEKAIFLAVEIEGKAIGSVGITFKDDIYRKNAEIGYFIGEDFWGKGYMTEIIKEITKYTFSNFDIIRIYAEPFEDNKASRRALEKAGFKLEAVFKNYVIKNKIIKNSCIYSVLKEEFQ